MSTNQITHQTMISSDGSVKVIPTYLSDGLLKQGWHIVVNPKRNYYPEFDSTSPYYQKNKTTSIEEDNVLQVEVL